MTVAKQKRKTVKKVTARKPVKRTKTLKSQTVNKKAYWETYRDLQKRVDAAWASFKVKVKRKAAIKSLMKSKNELLLLLGECNYMAKECKKCAVKAKKRK